MKSSTACTRWRPHDARRIAVVTEVRRTPRLRKPNEGGVIDAVLPGSIADEIGLRPGDRVTAIDGRPLRDAVDFRFYATEDVIRLDAVRGGTSMVFDIEKHPDEDLGVGFQDAAFDGVRLCNNSCFFCFLKGNPKGLRKTLYVKDDDYRLSFAHGNFVTLTNLTDADWTRLDEQRLSPLNVSVHATEPALRRRMLGNTSAPNICEQLRRLGSMGIWANTQVVLCPGVNDGAALRRTIDDLGTLYPTVQTISIVPVGATATAEERIERGVHSADVGGCTPDYARAMMTLVAPYQKRFRKQHGRTLVYLADEYYLLAGAQPPGTAHYDGFPQFENGIGMARSLIDDWQRARRSAAAHAAANSGVRRISIVSGTLIAPVLERVAAEFAALTGIETTVHAISNTLFGTRVNVSGLLVLADLERQLRGRDLGDLAILPRYALDYTGGRFLDDGTPADLQRTLGVPIAFASTMREVLQIIREPLESPVAGATVAQRTNGKAWVDYSQPEGGAP
jgi:putative radical SAM enzyme (TIGR03279 family)